MTGACTTVLGWPLAPKLADAPMSDIIAALASGQVAATALVKGYLARIEAYDRDGPALNSVREISLRSSVM